MLAAIAAAAAVPLGAQVAQVAQAPGAPTAPAAPAASAAESAQESAPESAAAFAQEPAARPPADAAAGAADEPVAAPPSPPTEIDLAEGDGDWASVAEIARRSLVKQPTNGALRAKRIEALARLADWSALAAELDAWEATGTVPPVIVAEYRGDVARGQGDPEQARRYWWLSETVSALDKLAASLLEAGRFAEAVEAADKRLAAADDPEARLLRARALASLGRLDEALAEARRAADAAPNSAAVLKWLPPIERLPKFGVEPPIDLDDAFAFLAAGFPAAALAIAEGTLARAPGDLGAKLARGYALVDLGRGAEARASGFDPDKRSWLEPAVHCFHELAKALAAAKTPAAQAALLVRLGQFRLALALGLDALEVAPNSGEAAVVTALALIELGESGRALEFARRAVAAVPKDANAWFVQGRALATTADLAGAVAALDQAIKLAPKGTPTAVLKEREEVLRRLGRDAEADGDRQRWVAAEEQREKAKSR